MSQTFLEPPSSPTKVYQLTLFPTMSDEEKHETNEEVAQEEQDAQEEPAVLSAEEKTKKGKFFINRYFSINRYF